MWWPSLTFVSSVIRYTCSSMNSSFISRHKTQKPNLCFRRSDCTTPFSKNYHQIVSSTSLKTRIYSDLNAANSFISRVNRYSHSFILSCMGNLLLKDMGFNLAWSCVLGTRWVRMHFSPIWLKIKIYAKNLFKLCLNRVSCSLVERIMRQWRVKGPIRLAGATWPKIISSCSMF